MNLEYPLHQQLIPSGMCARGEKVENGKKKKLSRKALEMIGESVFHVVFELQLTQNPIADLQ
jgi:hypothetical protein